MSIVWIVDGAYLVRASAPRRFDYVKLKRELERRAGGSFAESYYLNSTGMPASPEQERFHDWLQSSAPHGPNMRVYLYPLKEMWLTCPHCGTHASRTVQAGVDVGIAVLMVRLAATGAYDRLVLCAGDGDFEDALVSIKLDFQKEIVLAGFTGSMAPELEQRADKVVWLDQIWDRIALAGS